MWDTGAGYNFMHAIEADLLCLPMSPSPIAYVVVGNEDLLSVQGQVSCAVQFESNNPVDLNFHVVSKLPYRSIIGMEGMKIINVTLDPSSMTVHSRGAVSQCVVSNSDDSLCLYIPADISSDHDDEMEVEAPTLEEVNQWAQYSEAPLDWQMPKICETTTDYFKSTMSDLCNQYKSIFTEFSPLDDNSDKEHFEIIVDKDVKPRFCTLGRIPLFQREKIEEFVTLFLKLGIIEPSNSPCAARPLLIKKGDSFRFCVN
jgi:hypothetical protein